MIEFTYSDSWHRRGCRFEERIPLCKPVYYRHVYEADGTLAGVIVDYEIADDVHFELTAENWKRFCSRYLGDSEDGEAFREFMEANSGWGDFEGALRRAGIEFKKMAFY